MSWFSVLVKSTRGWLRSDRKIQKLVDMALIWGKSQEEEEEEEEEKEEVCHF